MSIAYDASAVKEINKVPIKKDKKMTTITAKIDTFPMMRRLINVVKLPIVKCPAILYALTTDWEFSISSEY